MTYSSKLVDLPCIVESQKTYDSRHLFKVADISQVCLSYVGKLSELMRMV
jgi:transcription initiation factor TFIID subunit 7